MGSANLFYAHPLGGGVTRKLDVAKHMWSDVTSNMSGGDDVIWTLEIERSKKY